MRNGWGCATFKLYPRLEVRMDNIARMGQVLERFLRRFKRPPTRKELHRIRDKHLGR